MSRLTSLLALAAMLVIAIVAMGVLGGPGGERSVEPAAVAPRRAATSFGFEANSTPQARAKGRHAVPAGSRRAESIYAARKVESRRVSRLKPSAGGQRGTEVEPDSLSHGSKMVTAFQVGRYIDGGAAAIGWATSARGGRSWRSGRLPGLSSGGGRFSDPVVAYDQAHRTWLIASLRGAGNTDLVVSRSRNGFSWSRPIVAARGPDLDKEWIACDNWRSSRFRGRCYISYMNGTTGEIETQRSLDGGRTWSAPARLAGEFSPDRPVNGAQPLVRPDGTLIVAYVAFLWPEPDELLAMRSTDGGASFGRPVRITSVFGYEVREVRSAPLPSGDVDAAGRVYLAWHDCRFQGDCTGTDIVLVTSTDGVKWGAPRLVPTARGVKADAFIPGLAVAPGTRGATARLAVTYHFLPVCGPTYACPGIDVALVESRDGGRSWSRPVKLSGAPSMQLGWIADSGIGRMLGDYISTSWVNGRPIGVYSFAGRPRGQTFRQSIFAAYAEK